MRPVRSPVPAFIERERVIPNAMCHHFESVSDLEAEEREDVLKSHSEAELEAELSEEEREALTA